MVDEYPGLAWFPQLFPTGNWNQLGAGLCAMSKDWKPPFLPQDPESQGALAWQLPERRKEMETLIAPEFEFQ